MAPAKIPYFVVVESYNERWWANEGSHEVARQVTRHAMRAAGHCGVYPANDSAMLFTDDEAVHAWMFWAPPVPAAELGSWIAAIVQQEVAIEDEVAARNMDKPAWEQTGRARNLRVAMFAPRSSGHAAGGVRVGEDGQVGPLPDAEVKEMWTRGMPAYLKVLREPRNGHGPASRWTLEEWKLP